MKDICIIEKQLKDLDINDRFFDSLKNEYKDFIIWFNNHLDRKAYITFQDNKIASILILKIEDKSENYKDFNKEFKPSKRLKICTLKVDVKFKNIGTKYLELAYNEALKNNVNEIYITLYTNHKDLINLLEKNNYIYYCDKYNNEKVYINKIKKF
ncbi:MAG: hypothetical protein MSH48_06220 [Mollicutes bacterium]|nr:hypothetical protein [Mollicutes bacterium]